MAKTISVSDEVHEALRELGNKGDTFDDIIQRLLEEHEKSYSETMAPIKIVGTRGTGKSTVEGMTKLTEEKLKEKKH